MVKEWEARQWRNLLEKLPNGEDEPPLTIINRASLDSKKKIGNGLKTLSTNTANETCVWANGVQKIAFDEVFEELQKEKKTTLVIHWKNLRRIAESMVSEKTWTVLVGRFFPFLTNNWRYINNTQWPIGSFRILAVGSGM